MKRKELVLIPMLVFGLIGCDESGKNAEEIEQEYSTDTPTSTPSTTKTMEDLPLDTALSNSEDQHINMSNFEYLEDFATLNTKTKLYQTFGAENLVDGSSWFAEGTVEYQNTKLTDPNTLNVYIFNWSQEDNETLQFIEAPGFIWDENYEVARRQIIQSESGIFTGMSLKDLYEWNDKQDFEFSGFGWDYEGGVFAKKGTKIGDLDVIIKLTLDGSAGQSYTHLLGDSMFSTADKSVLDAPIYIDVITYSVEPGV